MSWIAGLPRSGSGLDLGCGKLRYTIHLAARLDSVTAVDSEVQVQRRQRLFGCNMSVREYAAAYLPNVRVCSVDADDWREHQYSIVLCSNVLSAIPFRTRRQQLLAAAYERLAPNGRLLVTTQYKNSYFKAWQSNNAAERFQDGFLVKRGRSGSFYGLIDAPALTKLCRSVGFTIVESGHVKELAYIVAKRT